MVFNTLAIWCLFCSRHSATDLLDDLVNDPVFDLQEQINLRSPASLLAPAHLLTLLMTEHNEVKDTSVAPGMTLSRQCHSMHHADGLWAE